MKTFKQIFNDFGMSFLIQKFPSFRLALLVIIIFFILVTCGGYFFHYYQSFYTTPSSEYTILIKILPKTFLLFLIIWYNFCHKVATSDTPLKLLGYIPSFTVLIIIFTIVAYLCKEFAGTLVLKPQALKCLAITSEPSSSLMSMAQTSRICTPQMPQFLIRAIPAILITAYFQLVISNMLTLLIANTIKWRKNEAN